MNRKGTEKPIEIFVALFIILAVAMVLLKLFNNQFSQSNKEIADWKQEEKQKELMSNVELGCQEKCTTASNNGCSLASLASLCLYDSSDMLAPDEYIDLNKDNLKNMDTTFLAGIGVCEEKLYCFHIMSNCCARDISPTSCKQILKEYWQSTGLVTTDAGFNTTLSALASAGTCSEPGVIRWDSVAGWG